ncbi:uncharacterized protein B0H64DRAFT_1424 [Chaetomium fimeti]|uniref:Uncharacterized protein n=1 Tax=Chaetomium fimeti TaxID=1854472 RepID=A0AAE0LW34_9PEZI|nr:hypothetical protein B0H64DRAFT_1424 [Chaetomium fimeti]
MKSLRNRQTVINLSAQRRTPACPTSKRCWLMMRSGSSTRGHRVGTGVGAGVRAISNVASQFSSRLSLGRPQYAASHVGDGILVLCARPAAARLAGSDQSDPPGCGCSTPAGQHRLLNCGMLGTGSGAQSAFASRPFLAHTHTQAHAHTNTHTPLPHTTQATTGTEHAATRCTPYAPGHTQRVQKDSVHGTSPEAHGGGISLLLRSPRTLVVQTCMVLTRHVACSGIVM